MILLRIIFSRTIKSCTKTLRQNICLLVNFVRCVCLGFLSCLLLILQIDCASAHILAVINNKTFIQRLTLSPLSLFSFKPLVIQRTIYCTNSQFSIDYIIPLYASIIKVYD